MRDIMLILHFIGLAMGLGTAFAHAFTGFSASKMSGAEALKFKTQLQILGVMGNIGLLLLIISGIYLIIPYWSAILFLPMLVLKLVLVVVLIVLIGIINMLGKKAQIDRPETRFKQAEKLGKVALLTTLAIVVVAVLVFH